MEQLPLTYKIIISGAKTEETEYGMEEIELESLEISRELFSSFSIGNAASASMSVRLRPKGNIPRCAKVVVQCDAGDGFISLGTFFIDTRRKEDGWLTLNCYDAMLKAEVEYVTASESEWPKMMPDVLAHIAETIGVEVEEEAAALIQNYPVPDPVNSGANMREVLGWIGICHGGNFTITRENKLRLVPLATAEESSSGGNTVVYDKLISEGEDMVITGLRLINPDVEEAEISSEDGTSDGEYFAGSESGYVLEAECPAVTQAICDAVFQKIGGVVVKPYSINQAVIEPDMELGDCFSTTASDTIAVVPTAVDAVDTGAGTGSFNLMRFNNLSGGGVISDRNSYILGSYHLVGGACLYGSIGLAGDEELNHEYPYLTPLERAVKSTSKKLSSVSGRVGSVEAEQEEMALSLQGFESRITEEEMQTRIFSEWQTTTSTSLAEVQTKANDSAAMAGLIVERSGTGWAVNASVIVEAINRQTAAKITADNIIMNGSVQFVTPEDLSGENSTTVIYGGLIQTDTIDVQAIRRSTLNGSELVDFSTGINATSIEAGSISVGGSPVATQEWVMNQMGNGAAINLSGYATQEWVQNRGYATQGWVVCYVANLGGSSGSGDYATKEWVQNRGYATEGWVMCYVANLGGSSGGSSGSSGGTGDYAPRVHSHNGSVVVCGVSYSVYVT